MQMRLPGNPWLVSTAPNAFGKYQIACWQANRCFEMDLWQTINDKNPGSNHAESHTCCWVSPESVS